MEHTMHLSTPAPAVLPVALIASTDFTTEAEAIRDADDWREAVTALLEFWTALDRCYSSGEVAACFRTHRMDLRFSVTTVGEEIRNRFYNGELNEHERILPCKVSCALCGTPIADEGRHMWLAFPSLFDFGVTPKVPEAFKPTCHIFYNTRMIDLNDGLPKWSGHKNESALL